MSITLLTLLIYPTTPPKSTNSSRRRTAAAPSLILPHHPPLPQSQSRQCLLSLLSLLRLVSDLRSRTSWSRSGPRSRSWIWSWSLADLHPWSWSRSGPRSGCLTRVLDPTGVPPQQDTVPFTCPGTTVPQQRCWSSPSPTTHTSIILRRRTSPPPPSHCPHPPHLPLSPSQYRVPRPRA